MEHGTRQRLRKMREISEAAAMARSILHNKVRQLRASAIQSSQPTPAHKSQHALAINRQQTMAEYTEPPMAYKSASFIEDIKQTPSEKSQLPKVGDMVYVSSLGRKGTVLRLEPSKDEIVVQTDFQKVFDLLLEVSEVEKITPDRMRLCSSLLARKREGVAVVRGLLDGSLTTLLEENVVPSLEDLVKSVPKPEKLMESPSAISGEDYYDLIVFD
nr:hypothetical protein CFP56_76796 [Quercus suber]